MEIPFPRASNPLCHEAQSLRSDFTSSAWEAWHAFEQDVRTYEQSGLQASDDGNLAADHGLAGPRRHRCEHHVKTRSCRSGITSLGARLGLREWTRRRPALRRQLTDSTGMKASPEGARGDFTSALDVVRRTVLHLVDLSRHAADRHSHRGIACNIRHSPHHVEQMVDACHEGDGF